MTRVWIDMDLLLRLWGREWPSGIIAESLGVTISGVSQAARREKLPSHDRERTNEVRRAIKDALAEGHTLEALIEDDTPVRDILAVERGERPSAAPQKPKAPPVLAQYPSGWNSDRDCLVLATQGKYDNIADLAARFDMPSSRVLARYHRISRG